MRLVFCEDDSQLDKIEQIRARCPGVEQIVVFESISGAMSLTDIRDRGRAVEQALIEERGRAVAPQDVATIVYTSGTTGPVWTRIRSEYERTHEQLLAVTGQSRLLDRTPVLQRSIERRNPYVDPRSFIQLELLRRLRRDGPSDELARAMLLTINGIAGGPRNTG